MKTLIVYYSLEGNTAWTAERIAASCGFDLLRLEPVKPYPTRGFRKFFRCGRGAVMGEAPELKPDSVDPLVYDRILFGFPVWAGTFAPPIRSFILAHDLRGKRLAAFACQGGSGAEKAFARLRKALGGAELEAALVLNDPKNRPDPQNEDKLRAFCARL